MSVRSDDLPDDPQWCHHWCACPGSHWRLDAGRWLWRPGFDGCTHPRHDAVGVAVWGLSPADISDPVVRRLSGARSWFWCVLRSGELTQWGWADTARWALATAEGVACGLECGVPVRGPHAVRCDLVAAEGWRWLAERERRRVSGGESRAA